MRGSEMKLLKFLEALILKQEKSCLNKLHANEYVITVLSTNAPIHLKSS